MSADNSKLDIQTIYAVLQALGIRWRLYQADELDAECLWTASLTIDLRRPLGYGNEVEYKFVSTHRVRQKALLHALQSCWFTMEGLTKISQVANEHRDHIAEAVDSADLSRNSTSTVAVNRPVSSGSSRAPVRKDGAR